MATETIDDGKTHRLTTHETSISEGLIDTRNQLIHVVQVTEKSANKTLDLVENLLTILKELIESSDQLRNQCIDLSEEPVFQREREQKEHLLTFMAQLSDHSDTMRRGLTTVMETQGFQDISGQIINRVITLLEGMEGSLGQGASTAPTPATNNGSGPAINPDKNIHCHEQEDVDDLLAGLGL
jgi:chemotaxis protein CheZ